MADIGIDLGTYNSAACYLASDGKFKMVAALEGVTMQGTLFPSFVEFNLDGSLACAGSQAQMHLADKPSQVIWGAKRLIGKPYAKVQNDLAHFAYKIEADEKGYVQIVVGNKKYSPKDIAKIILEKIKRDSEGNWNPLGKVERAVITHPAYFDTPEIEATRAAAKEAGFKEIELIAEPVAATLAYQLKLSVNEPQTILTIDWGAGTLDIVLATINSTENGGRYLGQLDHPFGDVQLGGIDIDDSLVEWAISEWHLTAFESLFNKMKQGIALSPEELMSQTNRELNTLRKNIEEAKIRLSTFDKAPLNFTHQGEPQPKILTRQELEKAVVKKVETAINNISFTLNRAGMSPNDIDHVLLIGGPMNMPCVRRAIAAIFASNPKVIAELNQIEEKGFPINPMEAVAIGAAMQAQLLWGSKNAESSKTINKAALMSELGQLVKTTIEAKTSTFTYGVTLNEVVIENVPSLVYKVIVKAGQKLPCKFEFAQGSYLPEGTPIGQGLPIKLLKQQVDRTSLEKSAEAKTIWNVLDDYRFVPHWGNDRRAYYKIKGNFDEDGVLTLQVATDESALELSIARLDGKPIDKPLLTEEEYRNTQGRTTKKEIENICDKYGQSDLSYEEKVQWVLDRLPPDVPPHVTRDEVIMMHQKINETLKAAQQEMNAPSTDPKKRQDIQGKIQALISAQARLPKNLSTDSTSDEHTRIAYSNANNAKENLRHALTA